MGYFTSFSCLKNCDILRESSSLSTGVFIRISSFIRIIAFYGLFGALLSLLGVVYLIHKNTNMINTLTMAIPIPNHNSPRTLNLSKAISYNARAPSGGSQAT